MTTPGLPSARFALCCVPALLLCTATPATAVAEEHPIVPAFERFSSDRDASLSAMTGRVLLNELRCAACHEGLPQSRHPRNAPDLSDVGGRLRPEAIRKIVAQPHAAKPGTLMPDLMHGFDAARRSREAEALTHFLVADRHIVDTPPSGMNRGEKLFHEVGCVACHQPQREDIPALPTSVPLEFVDQKYTVGSLSAFLRDPHAVRPSGRMPNLNLTDQDARDIAGYLLRDIDVPANLTFRYYEGSWESLPNFDALEPKSSGPATGFDVGVRSQDDNFGLVFEGFLHVPQTGEYTFELVSDDGSRLLIDGRPIVNNDGIHGMQLVRETATLTSGTHPVRVEFFEKAGGEDLTVRISGPGLPQQDLAGLVTATAVPPEVTDFQPQPKLAAAGRIIFSERGCASCHQLQREATPVGTPVRAGRLSRPDRGCLAEQPTAGVPDFHLSAAQREALANAIGPAKTDDSDDTTIRETMLTFNCFACHRRQNVGGVERLRDPLFTTTIPEMGDEGRIPPALDGAGDKLNRDWLAHILNKGARDRPYMLTHMPAFGQKHVGGLVDAFARSDSGPPVAEVAFEAPPHRVRAAGRYMVGDQALSCIKCHDFGKYNAVGIRAMDLQTMTRRLRRDWFHRYLLDPQTYRPGTRMPAAWPNGRSVVPDVLDGRPATQIEAIWLYLSQAAAAPIPSGLIAGRMELKPRTEPILYRNFITSLSPRGIAVGYPEKVHIAWDASDASLALIWQGAFIDAAKHWVGRGQGTQEPLGDNRFSLVRGVPVGRLDDPRAQPWPTDTPIRFRGYRLSADRRPVFRYTAAGVDVIDDIKPVRDQPFSWLQRTVTISGPNTPGLYFRAASAKSVQKLADDTYLVDNAIEMNFPRSTVLMRRLGDHTELLIPVDLRGGETRIVQQLRW